MIFEYDGNVFDTDRIVFVTKNKLIPLRIDVHFENDQCLLLMFNRSESNDKNEQHQCFEQIKKAMRESKVTDCHQLLTENKK
jgi:trehalose/maltose hydrolase-like predicted phosphorylase